MEITGCHSYYTQELCHFIWEKCRGGKKVELKDIDKAIAEIMLSESSNYNNTWGELTAKQRGFLSALAENPQMNVYSNDFNVASRLGTTSTIQRITKLLYDKQIIEKENGKVYFEDVFFEMWIREKTTPNLH